MSDEQDVTPESSTEGQQEPNPETGSAAVTAEKEDGRPLKNVLGEWNRKFTKVERQQMEVAQRLDAIAQMLLAQQQNAPRATAAAPGSETDEDLWGKAQMGDRLAFEEYQRRIARREYQQANTAQSRTNMVGAQMAVLLQKYPVLNDGSHPLTQYANQAYQLLLRNGYPAGQETLLEAAKTAITDRPDLVSELHMQGAQAREGARRSATSVAQAGQTGTSLRQEPAQPRNAVIVRPGEADIARRMGIKDPKKAKERFLERQAKGQSALGAVSGFVREEDF